MKTRYLALLCTSAVMLQSACARQESAREIDWAKAALARNPAFEIVATDEAAGVFTVRDTASGEVHALKLEELIAAPLAPKSPEPAGPELAPAVAPAAAATSEPEVNPTVAEDAAPSASQTTETVEVARAGSGQSLAEGPGYSITRGEDPSIHSSMSATAVQREPASGIERRTQPIICQGNRLMRIDGETIEFTGNAVIAEKGCDLYISNARIRAGGVGLIARQARVHIVNSTIDGTLGSYEASEGAEIYVARSTITGVGRRFDTATMNDLGGNAYQMN